MEGTVRVRALGKLLGLSKLITGKLFRQPGQGSGDPVGQPMGDQGQDPKGQNEEKQAAQQIKLPVLYQVGAGSDQQDGDPGVLGAVGDGQILLQKEGERGGLLAARLRIVGQELGVNIQRINGIVATVKDQHLLAAIFKGIEGIGDDFFEEFYGKLDLDDRCFLSQGKLSEAPGNAKDRDVLMGGIQAALSWREDIFAPL